MFEIKRNEIQAKFDAGLAAPVDPVRQLNGIIDQSKSFEEQTQDVVTVLATKKALEDESLVKDITDLKKDELTEHAKASYKKGQANSQVAEKDLQKALFGVYEGLASYMGLKRELPKGMLKVLMFFAQPVLGILFLASGLVVGTINILMDGVNSIAEKFATLSGITQRIVKSLLWIILAIIFLLVVNYVLTRFGIYLI